MQTSEIPTDSGNRSAPGLGTRVALWAAAHPFRCAGLILLAALIVAGFLLHSAGARRLRNAYAPIIAAGEPVTLEDLKAMLPEPGADNAGPTLLEAARRMSALASEPQFKQEDNPLPIINVGKLPPRGEHLSEAQRRLCEAYISSGAASLAVIRESAARRVVYPIQFTEPVINILLPHLSEHRMALRVLSLEAFVAADVGRPSEAFDALSAMCSLDKALVDEPFLISALVRMAGQTMTVNSTFEALALTMLDDAQLDALTKAFRLMEERPSLRRAMLAERVSTASTLRWAYGGGSIGTVTQGGPDIGIVLRLVPGLKELDEAVSVKMMTRVCNAATHEGEALATTLSELAASEPRMPTYAVLSRIMLPSLSRSLINNQLAVAALRAGRVGLAAERFRLRHARWPERLAELAPEFIDAVPVDPFTGRPLILKMENGTFCVYSVGEDLNDNGGDVERSSKSKRPTDAGILLLDPALRGRPSTAPAAASQPANLENP